MSDNIISSPPSQLPLRDKLFHISRDLSEEETHKLKFLLKDLLPKTELTANVKARHLFQCLEERVKIQESNPKLLVQCLVLIGRERLAAKYFPNHDKRMQTDYLSDFRLKLFEVATELKHKEKDHLLEVFSGIPKATVESITTSCDLLAYLEERVIIAEQYTTRLQTALREIGRNDLANVLVIFHGGVPSEESQVISQACPSISSSASSSTTSFSSLTDKMAEGKMSMSTLDVLMTAARSVGHIGGGTGFRVGSRYIMTASHVVKMALGFSEFKPVTFEQIQEQLEKQELHIHFTRCENLKPIRLLKIVFYLDRSTDVDGDSLDVTIAELEPCFFLPDPLLNFYDELGTDTHKKICFLGHDRESKEVEIGFSWTLVEGPVLEAISSKFSGPYEKLFIDKCGKDPRRVQFQGPFREGGSGSPGVVVRDGMVQVFTILTHGFFYNSNIPNSQQIQEGTRMWCLKEFLKQGNVILCEDIFRGWD